MKAVPIGCSDAAKDGHAIARISPITSPASICKGKAKLTRVVPLAALVMSDSPKLTDLSRAKPKASDSQVGKPVEGGSLQLPPPRQHETGFWVHTVATALAGEPTAPGSRSGGAVSRKRERPLARSQSARSDNSQISPR